MTKAVSVKLGDVLQISEITGGPRLVPMMMTESLPLPLPVTSVQSPATKTIP